MKKFLAAGDILINTDLLEYAVVQTDTEGPKIRLGFKAAAGKNPSEVLVEGFEARSILRWLRSNATFLDAGSPTSRDRPALVRRGEDFGSEFERVDLNPSTAAGLRC